MTRSKRAKTTAASTATNGPDSGNDPHSVQALPHSFSLFQTAPSLERTPDDILLEILSHLSTVDENHVLYGQYGFPYSTQFVRSSTLRALSQTSRLLRTRCLAMAWQRIELCKASIPINISLAYRETSEATKTTARVLKASPDLRPLVQIVSVVLTRFRWTEVLPKFAACLASLPNLHTIRVIHTEDQMKTSIAKAFRGKRLSSVRKIYLPNVAHEIIKCCPNLEEVICPDGNGKQIIESLVKGKCNQLRILKGLSFGFLRSIHHEDMAATSLKFVDMVPNLNYIGVGQGADITPLTSFPQLDTIEIFLYDHSEEDKNVPLSEVAAVDVKKAKGILKESKSPVEKTVRLTRWNLGRDHWSAFKSWIEDPHVQTEIVAVERV